MHMRLVYNNGAHSCATQSFVTVMVVGLKSSKSNNIDNKLNMSQRANTDNSS